MTATTVLLCGVGGQGTILAADLLAKAALAAGYDVKVSEIHGMAQRGGSVSTVVKFGEDVASMVNDLGMCDCVVSFETTEALRNIGYVKEKGYLLVSDQTIKPLPVACGYASMPSQPQKRLREFGATLIPAAQLAQEAGNSKCENVVLLGALETQLGFGQDIWARVIEARVPPKTIQVNLEAFSKGYGFASSHAQGA